MTSPPLRVLVVDDEAPARRKVLRLLRDEEGVEVVGEADGGEAAIAAVRRHSPDLVFLDVQMPGVDGFGVMRCIVEAKLALPRIIFVTAHDKFALRAFEVHAFDYLLKPVGEERFRAALRRARQQHEQSTDAFASRLHTMLAQLHRERSFPERLLIHEDARAFLCRWARFSGLKRTEITCCCTAGRKRIRCGARWTRCKRRWI